MTAMEFVHDDDKQGIYASTSPGGEVFLRICGRDGEPASVFLDPSEARDLGATLIQMADRLQGVTR